MQKNDVHDHACSYVIEISVLVYLKYIYTQATSAIYGCKHNTTIVELFDDFVDIPDQEQLQNSTIVIIHLLEQTVNLLTMA